MYINVHSISEGNVFMYTIVCEIFLLCDVVSDLWESASCPAGLKPECPVVSHMAHPR